MYRWFFIIMIIFLNEIHGRKKNPLLFTKNRRKLANCIEDHDAFKVDEIYKDFGIDRAVGDIVARKFYNKTKTIEETKILVTLLINQFRQENVQMRNISWMDLEIITVQALIECSEDDKEDKNYRSYPEHVIDLPHFLNEPPGIGVVLDYVLVNWTEPLEDMIQTRNGLSVLRNYAHDSRIILQNVLNFTTHDEFRFLIRSVWNRRAFLHFDPRNDEFPYFCHRYSSNCRVPHTHGDLRMFYTRLARNRGIHLRVQQIYLDRILNIHSTDRPGYGEFDVFSVYETNGMSSTDYYIENYLNQFYRILFFVQELEARGLRSNNIDIPEDLQEMIRDDNAYRDYLLRRRNDVLERGRYINNEIIQNLARSARVNEENLVMAQFIINRSRSLRISISTSSTSTTTITTKATTLSTTTPSTTSFVSTAVTKLSTFKKLKKGSVWRNKYGKCFIKRPIEFLDNCSEKGSDISNKLEIKKFIDSLCFEHVHNDFVKKSINFCSKVHIKQPTKQIESSNQYFGCIIDTDDLKNLFPYKEDVYLKLMHN